MPIPRVSPPIPRRKRPFNYVQGAHSYSPLNVTHGPLPQRPPHGCCEKSHNPLQGCVRLFTDTQAGQCLQFIGGQAHLVNSGWVGTVNRFLPWVDAVALESGRAGDVIAVANIHGAVYELDLRDFPPPARQVPIGTLSNVMTGNDNFPVGSRDLYLGRDGFIKHKPEGTYVVLVGRYISPMSFIFDSQAPERASGHGRPVHPGPAPIPQNQIPPLVPNKFLFNDGVNMYWRSLYASDINPDFEMTLFTISPTSIPVGTTVSSLTVDAEFNDPNFTAYLWSSEDPDNRHEVTSFPHLFEFDPPVTSDVVATMTIYIEAHNEDNIVVGDSLDFEWTDVPTVPVTGITIADGPPSMAVGDTFNLVYMIEPSDATNQDVIWGSDDHGVATVDDGEITAVGSGSANITVTTVDGGFSDVVSVVVD